MPVAVKIIQKNKINKVFGDAEASFCELILMEEVCQGQVANMLQLVESFEDASNYYTVTDYMPRGDLLGVTGS